MNNQNLIRGLFIMAIAMLFGAGAFQYQLGTIGRAGPGYFPLLVSAVLLVLGIVMVVRSWFEDSAPMSIQFRYLGIITLSLIGFALITHFINMTVAIGFLVFFSSLGAKPYPFKANIKIAICLLAIAVVFQKLLDLNLPLY